MVKKPAATHTTATETTTVVRHPVAAPSGTPTVAAEEPAGLSPLALALLIAVPGALLLIGLVPDRIAATAGGLGRAVVHARLALIAVAIAIWVGVFLTMALGGQT